MQSEGPESATSSGPTAWATRALRLFGDVSASETRDVVMMFLNIFTLLVAYYILKTVREPLILATGGAELKSYAAAGQAAVLLGYVPLYGMLAARLPVQRLVTRVNLAMVACIQLFFVLGRANVGIVGFAFYVFVGIFSLTLIAQFWSFANDIYRKAEGDRLFPVIAVGATAGAPLGAALASEMFARGVGPWAMMQISSALLLLHTWMYTAVRRGSSGEAQRKSKSTENGFLMVLNSHYLRLIAALLVVLNIINTTGEYILANLVTEQADALAAAGGAGFDKSAFIGEFYGEYFLGVNIASVLLQMFLVSRLVKYFGMAGMLFTLPIVAFGAYGMAMSGAGIALVRWVKTAENASDYSVMNTTKQMLWLPTTREEKYAAKQAIDTFFVRCGDLLSAGVVFVGTQQALSTSQFAATNIFFVVLSLIVAWLLLRQHRDLTNTGVATQPEPTAPRLSEARA